MFNPQAFILFRRHEIQKKNVLKTNHLFAILPKSFSPILEGRKKKRKNDQLGYKNYSFFTLPLQAFIPNGFCSCCSLASHKQHRLRCAYSICFAFQLLHVCLLEWKFVQAQSPFLPCLIYTPECIASAYNKLNEILLVVITSNTRMGYICRCDIWLLLPWCSVAQNHPVSLVHIMGMVFLLLIYKSLSIMPLAYM